PLADGGLPPAVRSPRTAEPREHAPLRPRRRGDRGDAPDSRRCRRVLRTAPRAAVSAPPPPTRPCPLRQETATCSAESRHRSTILVTAKQRDRLLSGESR